jgi:Flp pilus assembly protein CpaB
MNTAGFHLRLDRRTLVGIALAILAAVLVLFLTRPHPGVAVLYADGPLPAGVPLEQLPLTTRQVPDATGLVAGDSAADLAGWTLAAPLAAGEPLVASLLRPAQREEKPDVLALSLDRDHAVLGELQAGDLVDVYVAARANEGSPTARLVAAGVYVVAAGPAPSGLGGDDNIELLLAVDGPLAVDLVTARSQGDLSLVRTSR